MKVVIIIPTYNEKDNIEYIYSEITKYSPKDIARITKYTYFIYLFNAKKPYEIKNISGGIIKISLVE